MLVAAGVVVGVAVDVGNVGGGVVVGVSVCFGVGVVFGVGVDVGLGVGDEVVGAGEGVFILSWFWA